MSMPSSTNAYCGEDNSVQGQRLRTSWSRYARCSCGFVWSVVAAWSDLPALGSPPDISCCNALRIVCCMRADVYTGRYASKHVHE